MTSKTIAFVSGVARSGTSALVNLMNVHPQILMGQERFFWLLEKGTMHPEHFEAERFLEVRPEDSHIRRPFPKDEIERFGNACVIGDKHPNLFEFFPVVFERFPAARHIYILRNPLSVIESYDRRHRDTSDPWNRSFAQGLREWNQSVAAVASLSDAQRHQFLVVEYESVFADSAETDRIFHFLDLEPPPESNLCHIRRKFEELNQSKVPRRDDLRRFVAQYADWESYRKLLRTEAQA